MAFYSLINTSQNIIQKKDVCGNQEIVSSHRFVWQSGLSSNSQYAVVG